MKKLLALLALIPAIALAEPTYRINNKSGGEIVLTSKQCSHKDGGKLKHGYSYAKGGKMMTFCWYLDTDGMVKVIYLDDFSTYVYPAEDFRKVEQR